MKYLKILLYCFLLLITYGLCRVVINRNKNFNVECAVEHLNRNCKSHSTNKCALYVYYALEAGGKKSVILPAWGYKYLLPIEGFKKVDLHNYTPQAGDIVVFPKVKHHIYGHVAMYNGNNWVSDFNQKNFIVAKEYKKSKYSIFRFYNK